MFITETIRHPLDQFDLVVETLRHAVRVAVSDVTHDRIEPARQCPRYPVQRLVDTLAGSLNQLHKRLAGGLFIFAFEPCSQVLHPVKRFTPLGKAPTPLVTRDQLVDIELVGRLQPTFPQLLSRFGFLWSELFVHRTQDLVQHIHGLLDDVEAVDDVHLVTKDLFDGGKECLGHI